ncbi:ATP-binding cassette subfamily B protein RaxB [Sphingomonas sp. SORGH_AS 950]|uniref:peptidase domain-containing ABC transporter n=1 Tax=Sphingomonas sp. SORGH_AS_0950 TaxID=3041792 RepID=UPI002786DB91|nr:peptidase domain-containing ABC transporter [Sphingomonas sp. SORGH_AS_0950]MDQ1159503.1 ATP-binding cassette subfamily B protein RaxB [Sphingomonas sp. SORGH_AS_0950]
MAFRAVVRSPATVGAMLDFSLWRRQRVALVRQSQAAECGLAALTMIANFHGFNTDLGTMRRRFEPSLRGATLTSLIGMADEIGLTPRAVKLPLDGLTDLYHPAILHWDMNHYVVLEAVKNGKALIHNPEGTSKWLPIEALSPHFTGVALELRPADDFVPVVERQKLKLSQLWRRITGLKRAILQTILLSLVLEAFVLASPYYMQVALDDALPALDGDLLTILALGFGLFTVINAGASLLRSFVLLSTGTSIGYAITSNVARRLFRLPISWFEKRHVGDVLSRFQSVTPVQQFMTEGAVSAIIDGTLTAFTLALMFFYSGTLTLLALAAFALYGAVRGLSFPVQRRAQEDAIVAGGREQLAMIESLRGIVTLRLFNRETARHMLWQTRLTDSTNATVSLARIRIWQTTANTLILGLETIASVWLAVRLVIDGGFSIGMVFAYMAYKTQFLQRGGSLIDQWIGFTMLGLHLERLSDIALTEQDRGIGERAQPARRLIGKVQLIDVRYRYSPTDPVVLENVTFDVQPGEIVAITGPSGGGKSTLAKVLLGLVEPDEGEMLIDDKTLQSFGYRNFRNQVAAVLQEDSLFVGSLADNIALFDDDPDFDRVVTAATAAAIHSDIMAMPMAYDTLIGDMGSALSGGQKQRVLLARALYRQPRMLVMDEGTSHLDTERERMVNQAIAGLGITRIIIAHRLETILSATRIFAMEHGRITDVTERYNRMRTGN